MDAPSHNAKVSHCHVIDWGGTQVPDKATETAPTRRVPAQQRSRERQERILAVAMDLISSKGSDQVKMSEIAAMSQISIGSLYQYFPDKSSIIRTLAERYNAQSRVCIEQALGEVEDVRGLQAAYSTLLDQYYDIVLATPAMRDIWSGMQADKQLLELELQESRIAGDLLAQAMQRVSPGADAQQLADAAFLIWHLGEATMRLAVSSGPEEGRRLVEAFKRMSLHELLGLVRH